MTANNKRKILLIGWDAADWEHINPLLDKGLLPNMEKFINEGVIGNLATLQPILSPMLWNSATTGKYAFKHGIHGFVEPDRFNGGARPFSSYSRKCKALWNIYSQQGLKSNVINWWASHPAEKVNGCIVSNIVNGTTFKNGKPVAAKGVVHPAEKTEEYAQYRVLPNELEAEQICSFIPRAEEVNQEEDSRLQMFANVLAETLTTHAVGTAVMENEPWDFMAIYYTCIDHFAHGFMPYHPPKMPHIDEKDFEIFKDVMTGAYRFSDLMLGRLLQLAGEDTTVILCSDHGFMSGDIRPIGLPREPAGPAIWHRRYGIFMMKGPGIKKDERIYGASLIDIAPTILVAAGMPVGEDMDGRPLLEAFEEPPEVKKIPSWEDVEGEFPDGMHGEEEATNPDDAEDLLKQFIALGYVDDVGEDKEKQFEGAEIESAYNVARNYLFAGRSRQAVPLMEEIVARAPWETRFITFLVQCYESGGYTQQALDLIDAAYDMETTPNLMIKVLWVELQIKQGNDRDERLTAILQSIESHPQISPAMLRRIGQVYAKLRRWKDAERVYLRTVEMHHESAEAWQGLSRVYCRLGDNQKTVDCALEAVSLIHRLPHAHLNLGIALARSGEPERAVTAFKTALQFSPGFVPAHRWLTTVYRSQLQDDENATVHSKLAEEYQKRQTAVEKVKEMEESTGFVFPEFLSEEERDKVLCEERPSKPDPRKPSGKSFVIVSGLPRSGTSLMMQMLEAGGLPAKTDGERVADIDNPKGYYEWEAIKRIKVKPELMNEEGLEGKAIKAVTMILDDLPYAHNYKIIFMTRPIDEVVASQEKMIDRLQTDGSEQSPEQLKRELVAHRNYVRRRMETNPRAEILEVDYPSLIESPAELSQVIANFIGPEKLPAPENMAAVVDPTLHRHKV